MVHLGTVRNLSGNGVYQDSTRFYAVSFLKAHRNVHVIRKMRRGWKFALLQRLPNTRKCVGLVFYVQPQNMAIFSDHYNERHRRRVSILIVLWVFLANTG
jgi:hypothetical protein